MVRDVFEHRLAEVETRLAELEALRDRMRDAMAAWSTMPDGTPDGHTICRLIEHWDDSPERQTETLSAKGGQDDE